MARRIVTLVLDLDEQGNPVEINRAWSEDEVLMPNGALGTMPKVNVEAATLAGLLPDLAGVTAQLVATQDARDAALAEKTAAETAKAEVEADRDQKVAAAEAYCDAKVAAALAAQQAAEGSRDAITAEKDACIAELEAQIAALTALPHTVRTNMIDLWRRATDAEGEAIEAMIAGLPAKLRGHLNSVSYVDHTDEQFANIRLAFAHAFGIERAAELLAPSSGS